MCTYLHGPLANGMYYFRRSIPARLRPILGKREFFFSLRTKDPATAKRLVIQTHGPAIQAEIDDAEAKFAIGSLPILPKTEAQRRAEAHQREQEDRDDELSNMCMQEDWAREDRIASQEEKAKSIRAKLTGSTADMAPEDAVIARLLREGKEAHEIEREDLLNEIAKLKASQESAGDSQSAQIAPPLHTLPNFSVAAQRTPQRKSDGIALTDLFDHYAKEAQIRPATVEQWRKYINHLVAFIGYDDAGAVTTDDLLRWRQHLKTETFRGKPLSSKTINGSYLAAASVTFAYGFSERILPGNPMRDVDNVRADRKPKLRDGDFTVAERKLILSAASAVSQIGRQSKEKALSRRWVPWICAYTGARVNEITQLRKEDFTKRDGIWCIHITPEAGGVKTEEARYVPIHEHLIEQGLLQVIDAAADGPLFYDLAKSRGGKRPPYKMVGQRVADWVRDDVGLKDERIKPSHAWRHTFKTICREAEIDEGAADYMQGHASKGVARHYGSNTLPALAKQLAKFPRFEID